MSQRASVARSGRPRAHLVLRYNAVAGRDPLPRIRELAQALNLEVGAVDEHRPSSGKRIKVVSVRGELKGLSELERQLLRFPSVTAKRLDD